MDIKAIYDKFDEMGIFTFATVDGGEPEQRIAHFTNYDEDGLYFMTMVTKPFYKQLMETKKVSAAGLSPSAVIDQVDNENLHFNPGYTLRVTGDVHAMTAAELEEKAAENEAFTFLVADGKRYPAIAVFCLYNFRGEYYDYDFSKETRDHKLERQRFYFSSKSWRGTTEPFPDAGLHITDSCIECGNCKNVCTFSAITPGTPYSIDPNRCDECGSCFVACPVGAIEAKGGLTQAEFLKLR